MIDNGTGYKLGQLFDRNKNNKLLYYVIQGSQLVIPKAIFRSQLNSLLSSIREYDVDYIKMRLSYYNKLSSKSPLPDNSFSLSSFKYKGRQSTYFLDTNAITRYFDPQYKISVLFGDVTVVPEQPAFLKSRPVGKENTNSILLNLNKIRHFLFAKDNLTFNRKKNQLVWRGGAYQEQRERFMKLYYEHPLCDIGQVRKKGTYPWMKRFMSISKQLEYKFILSIEGNDVASNLKWIMSSHSLAVMPPPRYETWFMEGTLKPGLHYIPIKHDFSDLEEQLTYYIKNPDEAIAISKHANQYVAQFRNRKRERLIGLLVLQKYFYYTGQLTDCDTSLFE